jgi:hypothetical protein
MHILTTIPTTTIIISTIKTEIIIYITAETNIAEDHEIENALKDHERSYEKKAELQF